MEVTEVFKEFMKERYKSSYGIRDNCGLACLDLMDYFRERGIKSDRVQGNFKCDIPVHAKKDFTETMKEEFSKTNLDFNKADDRLQFLKDSIYFEEWHLAPHYWVEVQGKIFDPSGQAQFVDSGLASDLDLSRYQPNEYD